MRDERIMKSFTFTILLTLMLTACSSRENRDAKLEPIIIDKKEIDISLHNLIIKGPSKATNTEWICKLFKKSEPLDEDARVSLLVSMDHRQVRITDGTEVLAIGQFRGTLYDKEERYHGVTIEFPSPEIIEDLEKKLGIRHPELPPNAKWVGDVPPELR